MKPYSFSFSDHQRLWFYRGLTLFTTALLVHLLAVWSAPRLIMHVLMNGEAARSMNMHNRAAYPAPVDASARSVVMPSPDMLYSVCAFDVRQGPVRITADPRLKSYWSIALYTANSDNFFVVNDRMATGKPVNLWLVSEGANVGGQQPPAGAEVVVSPSPTGFLLMRVLTGDYAAEKHVLEPARRTLQCTPA